MSNTSYSIDDRELWSSSSTPFPGLSDWTFIDDVRVDRADGIFGSSAVDGFVVLYVNKPLGILGVGFRGTSAAENWHTNVNLDFTQDGEEFCALPCGRVHDGFNHLYKLLSEQGLAGKFAYAVNNYSIQKLLVTGHSLGAALATLFAYDIATTRYPLASKMQVVTFGSPRVGDAEFAQQYRNHVPYTIAFRANCGTYDIITGVPLERIPVSAPFLFWATGYEHVYGEVDMNGDPQGWITLDNSRQMSLDGFICHSMPDQYAKEVMREMKLTVEQSSCAFVDLRFWSSTNLPSSCPSGAPECKWSPEYNDN